jgi:cyclase
MSAPSLAQQTGRLEPVAEGLHAWVQPDGGWCLSNAGVITGGGSAILVDTAATRARAIALRDAVRSVAQAGPRLVVNTHHHGDHVFGNGVFAGQATIVAHEQCRAEMAAAGLGLQKLWPGVDWGVDELTLPAVTFTGRLTLHAGDLTTELLHAGPAHTTNDVVAWVPEHRVLFAGDVAMSGATPFCLMGSVRGSVEALGRLRGLNPRVVVPGHGPVAGPEVLDECEAYLHWVQRTAERGRRAGQPPLAAARDADLAGFGRLLDPERLVGNLHRAYAELDGAPPGAPIDIMTGFGEMIEYHGGPLPCSA